MKPLRWFVVLIAAAAFLASLWAAGDVSKLSAYGYIGRSGDTSLIVDMNLARYRGEEDYIPLWIWLGHREERTLFANRGTFTLTDPKGEARELAELNALRSGYGANRIANDYTRLRQNRESDNYGEMIYLNMIPLRKVAFFPNPNGEPHVLYDQVELPPRTYFNALIYFTNPAGKDPGEYILHYKDEKGGMEIDLPFTIPWSK